MLSSAFQMLPASMKKAPFKGPKIVYLYSMLNAILKLASLNSFEFSPVPGPNL